MNKAEKNAEFGWKFNFVAAQKYQVIWKYLAYGRINTSLSLQFIYFLPVMEYWLLERSF